MSNPDGFSIKKGVFSLILVATLFGAAAAGKWIAQTYPIQLNASQTAQAFSGWNDLWCDLKGLFGFSCSQITTEYVIVTPEATEREPSAPDIATKPTVQQATTTPVQYITNETVVRPVERETIREVVIRDNIVDTARFVTKEEYLAQVDAVMRSIENAGGGTTVVNQGGGGGLADITQESLEDLEDVASMTKSVGDLFTWNGVSLTNISTSSLGIVGTGAVDSVNGQTGIVVLDTGDVSESGNLYFTEARSRLALSEIVIGLDYATSTGIFSLTAGYVIPLSASTTAWQNNLATTSLLTASSTFWDQAYSWGNHASSGYLTSFTELDPVFIGSDAFGIAAADIADWDSAYLTVNASSTLWDSAYGTVQSGLANWNSAFAVAAVLDTASSTWNSVSNLVSASSSDWQSAFAWGNHAAVGYATGTNMWGGSLGGNIYTLNSGNVGIGTSAPNRKLTVFNTAAEAQQRLSYDGTRYAEFYVDAAGDLNVSTVGKNLRLLDGNLYVCDGGACPSTPVRGYPNTFADQGNAVFGGTIYADGIAPVTCPSGMIPVPPAPEVGMHNGFCVDKYETQNDGSNNAVSVQGGSPWVSITQYDARAQCLRAGKHLITEPEWLAIARSVEDRGFNWQGGTAGTNQMSDGHSDNSPASALATAADSSPCSGTGQSCDLSTWNSQRRVYQLSNDEYIWDFGGNVWEWVDEVNRDNYPIANSGTAGWQTCSTSGDGICGNTRTTNDQWYRGQTTDTRGFIRGGDWYNGANSGAFSLSLSDAPGDSYTHIGFRCAQ